jgi:HTH-type transcriptional regulator/antitoxin HigA
VAFPVAMLRSDPLSGLSTAERAWCFRARQLAEGLTFIAEFNSERLKAAEKKLRQLAAYPKEAERLPEILAYYGIRFVVVEPLPGTKIDGAAFWIDESPVIAVSARWDRIDAFWFTVMHEFMHIKNMDAYSVDVNLVIDTENGITIAVSDDAAEERANAQAANSLVPSNELQSFIARTSPYYASTKIIQFANLIKMHPGIIVGQLQHRGELRYSSHRDFLVKVRKYVVDTAVTDGWGRSLSPSAF